MVIFTPKKVIDGANNSEMITSSPYVLHLGFYIEPICLLNHIETS